MVDQKTIAFLADLSGVCRKHRMCLETDGSNEAMFIEPADVGSYIATTLRPNVVRVSWDRQAEFSAFLKRASDEVATWPEWKQNMLGSSMKATNDQPRPVISDDTMGCV